MRKVRIQTGVCQRINKEKSMYEKETEDILKEIETMKKTEGIDEYDIKKKGELFKESEMMVPDCEKRLAVAMEKMKELLKLHEQYSDNELYVKAQKVLAEVEGSA